MSARLRRLLKLTLTCAAPALWAGAAAAQPRPSLYVFGEGASTGYTSEQMYHHLFEGRRRKAAAAMAARGDCSGAAAYAGRQRSPELAREVRRLCPAPSGGAQPPDVDARIAAFAADPRHPLFALVTPDMIRLLRDGRAQSLQDAYDQAVAGRAVQARAELISPPGG